MVGVGTKDINMNGYNNVFCSLLGESADSWGLSYQAHFHHGGQIWQYGSMFGQGSLIGIHFDCWHGTLSFFKNRRPLGEKFSDSVIFELLHLNLPSNMHWYMFLFFKLKGFKWL